MFCDKTEVKFIAGKGGNGCVSFRREKFIPRGGPDGGDGGNGGDIILVADQNINTLADFKTRKLFKGINGIPGKGKKMHGKNAEPLKLKVPLGTMVFEENKLIADLSKPEEEFKIVQGGIGGLGNTRFKTSIVKAPTFAEIGEPGEEKTITLELKLVADVGLIGFPNAGKSTLISHISNAKPKIANYPFTTIVPNLGVVKNKFIVADVPGLIEGAHKGKGLGYDFLRHVSRTRVLVHLLDGTEENLDRNLKKINKELEKYDKELATRPQITVINKIDAITKEDLAKKKKKIKGKVLTISAVTGEGLDKLVNEIEKLLAKTPKTKVVTKETERKIFQPHIDQERFNIVKKKNKFILSGKRIEQLAVMTDFSNEHGVQRIYKHLNISGIEKALKKLGAKEGNIIKIGERELKFILWEK